MTASEAEWSRPSDLKLFTLSAWPAPSSIQAEHHQRGRALDLHRAVELEAHRVERSVRRHRDGGSRDRRHHRRADERALPGVATASARDEPRDGHGRDHDRERLGHNRDAEDGEAGPRPVEGEEQEGGEDERDREQVEVGPQDRAAQERHGRGGEHRPARIAAGPPRQRAAEQDHGRRSQERPRGERPAEGVLACAREPGQRDRRRGQRRVLERDVSVGKPAVENGRRKGAIDEQIVHALVSPRRDPERERPAGGEQDESEKSGALHANTVSRSASGSSRCSAGPATCAASRATRTKGTNQTM